MSAVEENEDREDAGAENEPTESSEEPKSAASDASSEAPAAPRTGGGKKKKKKGAKRADGSAKSDGSSSKSASKKKQGASDESRPKRREPAGARPSDEWPWGLVAIAVGVAIASVVGLYAWNHQGDSAEPSAGEESEEAAAQAPADPLAAPPDVAAPPANAERTASGLASRVLRRGTGTEHPGPTDRVTVHYTGWTTDGEMFDSSRQRGEPTTFPLNRVIAGWTEGVQLMVVGEQRRFWIPERLAYQGRPGAPAGMLVFDVELLSIAH